jgi:hypothetical protein
MTGPTVNLAEAARRSPRSMATLRRWLVAGTIPGAERDFTGAAWVIPIAGLVESGAWPSTTPPDAEADTPEVAEPAASDALEDALAQVADLEAALQVASHREADLRDNIADLRTSLRMLEAGPTPTPEKRPNIFQRLRERGEAAAEAPRAVVFDSDEAAMIRNARTCER